MGLSLALFAPTLVGLFAKAGQPEEMLRVGTLRRQSHPPFPEL